MQSSRRVLHCNGTFFNGHHVTEISRKECPTWTDILATCRTVKEHVGSGQEGDGQQAGRYLLVLLKIICVQARLDLDVEEAGGAQCVRRDLSRARVRDWLDTEDAKCDGLEGIRTSALWALDLVGCGSVEEVMCLD